MARPRIGVNMDFQTSDERPSGRFSVNASYLDALWDSGGRPCLVPCPDPDEAADWLDGLDGFLFIGGADYPAETYGARPHPEEQLLHARRSRADLALAKAARGRGLPILGICGGLQAVVIARGGALVQHLDGTLAHRAAPSAPKAGHPVALAPESRLRRLFGTDTVAVNSSHHQAADPQRLAAGLRVAATAPDGTIEALEDEAGSFLLLVQWHPETLEDAHRNKLFGAFVTACRPPFLPIVETPQPRRFH